MDKHVQTIISLSEKQDSISEEEARQLIKSSINLFRTVTGEAGYDKREITRLITKFRDAGRRSAPWKPTSSRVPGRPQDGADGNRINRWLMDPNHKFYADEITATLVEVRYIFQTLSMENAPEIQNVELKGSFDWLLGHSIEPGVYLDPIQLIPINFDEFYENPPLVQSGHLIPLDRGGKHVPSNAFLMLKTSNDLQGSLTSDELLVLMQEILDRHRKRK